MAARKHSARGFGLFAILSLVILWYSGVDAQGGDEQYVIVHLVNGRYSREGRVEISVNGTWGTICATNFSIYDAVTICHWLGYSGAEIQISQPNAFGTGKHPPLFTLGCRSYNKTILDCPISSVSCVPAASAGVKCSHGPGRAALAAGSISRIVISTLTVVLIVYVVCVIAIIGLLLGRYRFKQHRNQHSARIQENEDALHLGESTLGEPDTRHIATTPFVTSAFSHESILKRLCYMPFDINTITVAPLQGGVFDLMPLVQGVAEENGDMIQVEVSAGDNLFTLRHAVLVDGPFQLPEGFRLASDVVYLYSDPSQPFRPSDLHLPHWYSLEEAVGREEGSPEGDGLIFVMAPHTPSEEGGEVLYKFVLHPEGNFPTSSVGSLLIHSHSTLFAIAYKEKITSKLKYCATHLEREEPSGQKVDIAVTFASSTWQKILRQHRRQSSIKSKPTEFNFQSSQIVGKVQRVSGKKWKASLEGSAQISKEEINYRSHGIRSAEDLESAVKTGMYPPSLSFTVVYDTALKYNGRGRPSMVKLFCEGTTEGRLQFNSVVYEEKEDQGGEARGAGSLSLQAAAPSMMLLQDYIPQLADKWAELGTALGLEHQVLALRDSTQSPGTRTHSLLSDWVSAGDRAVSGVRVEVSWPFLVTVLRSPAVDKGSVASAIEARLTSTVECDPFTVNCSQDNRYM